MLLDHPNSGKPSRLLELLKDCPKLQGTDILADCARFVGSDVSQRPKPGKLEHYVQKWRAQCK